MPTWNKRDDHVNYHDLAEHIQSYLRDEADIKVPREVLRFALMDLFNYIAESIKAGDRIILREFGTFYRKMRKGYTQTNHRYLTGLSKPDRYYPTFKPSKRLTTEVAAIKLNSRPDRPKKNSLPEDPTKSHIPYIKNPKGYPKFDEVEELQEELLTEAMDGLKVDENAVFADYDPLTDDFLSDYTSTILEEVLKKGHKDINLQ